MKDRPAYRRLAAPIGLAISIAVSLTGCGTQASNRLGGGAAGGAATGATFGLIGGPIGVLVGGAVGGGIGALTAANTTPKQVNLGNPPWAGGGAASGAQGNTQTGASAAGQPQSLEPAAPASSYQSGATGSVQAQPLAPPR
ncbi:MAG: hypothetical protein B7Z59_11425 [Acidiphilium sp. 37-67-22]|jgi:hypothetical protein|uniref:hypothetical protein n=1 Tax=unclassified Acidiphilium TaxID=2617493 RepID=UPI000BC83864|nr:MULTISPECIES: hypothetical protein [unclassified Acidiphilium]OYV55024.1 MAG: hypothetical protein B7Z76_12185 [Acidiphilium sp. 20-67-58]OYV84786.1 MAG: hypothetical protein B7Z64_07020 [Acidiphilium sp. 21-68-69]OYW07630.1 MAG: hypothetical protein B7Z59_11425 [Acidiphilium sp. 37-67-22]HQT62224.1 hypothetical protein [Acidiphilium sp.]